LATTNHLKIGNDIIFPAAGYMAMAIEAVTQVYGDRNTAFCGCKFQNLHITAPLLLPGEGDIEVLFNLRLLHQVASKETAEWFDFKVGSVTNDSKWTEHAQGLIAVEETITGI
jgi:hypothetical protein